jgi:hypothetical protein
MPVVIHLEITSSGTEGSTRSLLQFYSKLWVKASPPWLPMLMFTRLQGSLLVVEFPVITSTKPIQCEILTLSALINVHTGCLSIATIYSMEFLTPSARTIPGSIGPWGEGLMLLAGLAYLVRPWRTLIWYSMTPYFLLLLLIP